MGKCFHSFASPRLGGWLVLAFALLACGQSALQSEPVAPIQPAESFDDGAWGRYSSARFGFSMGLPDGRAWKIDDRTTPWLRATHEKTGSSLRARTFYEARAVSRETCLERARALDASLPILDELVEDRIQTIGGDETSAHLKAAVRRGSDGELRGYLLVSGVSIRRCFVLVFESRASGPRAEKILAERLAIATDGIVPAIRFEERLRVPRSSRTGDGPGS